ncbi:MAG: DUF4430 domain-containing protein [Clostridia bacterium]|nr:DUF4430 domain-containing protein [Clostridia bacterium]
MKTAIRILLAALTVLFALASCFACKAPRVSDEYAHHCTLSVDCITLLDNMDELDPDKRELVPEDGVILAAVTVGFNDGDSVYDILMREMRARGIHIEASFVPAFNSAYIEGINNLYEFDCGYSSGWEYCVNGEFPGFGCSGYYPKEGDEIRFRYTCDLGADIGNEYNGE